MTTHVTIQTAEKPVVLEYDDVDADGNVKVSQEQIEPYTNKEFFVTDTRSVSCIREGRLDDEEDDETQTDEAGDADAVDGGDAD